MESHDHRSVSPPGTPGSTALPHCPVLLLQLRRALVLTGTRKNKTSINKVNTDFKKVWEFLY